MKNKAFLILMISLLIVILLASLFINRLIPSGEIDFLDEIPIKKNIEFENLDLGTNPGANITLVEFSDFKCPYCAQTAPDIKKILELYPDINFVYKHFHGDNKESARAALASECAREQNKFLEYHYILFERQIDFSYNKLIKFAQELNLDIEIFTACMESGTPKNKIQNDLKEAALSGVRGTPTYFINERKIEGYQPLSSLKLLIEQERIRVK